MHNFPRNVAEFLEIYKPKMKGKPLSYARTRCYYCEGEAISLVIQEIARVIGHLEEDRDIPMRALRQILQPVVSGEDKGQKGSHFLIIEYQLSLPHHPFLHLLF